MRMILGLAIALGSVGTASAQSIIDLNGSGGSASYDGTTLSGTATILGLTAINTAHPGFVPITNGLLTFSATPGSGGGTFDVTGSIPGVTGPETIVAGMFTNSTPLTPPMFGLTFFNGIGTGTLASNVATFFQVPTSVQTGLALTISASTPTFTNALVTSTDVTLKTVPEPSSFLLCSIPVALVAWKRGRRKAA